MKDNRDIQDDELRVIGRKDTRTGRTRVWLWGIFAVLVAAALGVTCHFLLRNTDAGDYYENAYTEDGGGLIEDGKDGTPDLPIEESPETSKAYAEHLQQTVNDIILDIYIPHNARPSLSIGPVDCNDSTIVFAAQAADIRADNGKINGAFVLNGEPVSWGLSKKGYVAIIGDKISIGVSENTPLFEEATEKGGCFFRQYPLVKDGVPVENKPKGKAIRKAICEHKGRTIMVYSSTPESFHDFSQALADLGVSNAVYLVGSDRSYGFWRDESGHLTEFSTRGSDSQKNENYIVFRDIQFHR